jgi:hypothetical protein
MKFLKILLIAGLSIGIACGDPLPGEPAHPAPKEFQVLEMVTGLHSKFDKQGYEFRIIEMDGSATVGLNPICLYLVVTNNSSGDDEQSKMVQLPQVSEIKKVEFLEGDKKVVIDVVWDRPNEDGIQPRKEAGVIEVWIPIKNGKLPEDIHVKVS